MIKINNMIISTIFSQGQKLPVDQKLQKGIQNIWQCIIPE